MKTGIIIAVVVVLLVAAAGIYYFNSSNYNGSGATYTPPAANNPVANTPATMAQQPTSTAPAPGSNAPAPAKTVSISNFAFNPSALTVKTGAKVTWTNNDSVTHTVTSDSGLFNSGPLSPGQSFSFTFMNSGTITYHCSIHPMMKGSVTVQN